MDATTTILRACTLHREFTDILREQGKPLTSAMDLVAQRIPEADRETIELWLDLYGDLDED